MPPGEAFTDAQAAEINRAVEWVQRETGWDIAIEVGAVEASTAATSSADSLSPSRVYAEALHAQLPDPSRSVLIQVDPGARTLEIVTGSSVRRVLDNRAAALVAVNMQTTFAGGDLTRGLTAGVCQLASLARRPKSLHTDTP